MSAEVVLAWEEDEEEQAGAMEGAAAQLAAVEHEMRQVEGQIERLLARQAALQEERERLSRVLAAEARAPRRDWQGAFEWDARVAQLLGAVFGLPSFRPLQREVINATLQGRDVLCLMPSGGGKSLCYQLPALLGGTGLTLVVSPLLSLIQDQVLGLEELGVHAAALTSLTDKDAASAISKQVEDALAGLRLLYCTPEKVVNSKRFFAKLEKVYKQGRLERIAIDEAHCCSQWGNDFRPDYKKLGILKQQFPDTPILALTATATQTVCDDVQSILRIDGCEFFRSSINRPNLFYEMKPKPASGADLVKDIAGFVSGNYPDGESGIVYVLTRKDAETLAEELRGLGISCAAYHADLDAAVRESVHRRWSQGRLQVICATIAFGMGINNPHVRFVVHHTISKSIDNYYQESGRAGRDGLPAHCRLYWRFGDYMRQASVVVMDSNWEPHLRGMLQYAAASGCRRAALCRHFGEAPPPCHQTCDCCKRVAGGAAGGAAAAAAGGRQQQQHQQQQQLKDVTEAAKGVVQTLQAWPGAEKRATLIQLVDKWRKESAAAKALSRDENEAVVQQLAADGYLKLDFGFSAYATNAYLKASAQASLLLQGKRQVFIPAQAAGGSAGSEAHKPEEGAVERFKAQQQAQRGQQQQQAAGTASGAGPAPHAATAQAAERRAAAAAADAASACAALEAARSQLAAAQGTIPAAVLTDDQVRQLAQRRPATQQQLAQLIGQQKAEVYGRQLLAALLGPAAGGTGRGAGGGGGAAAAAAPRGEGGPGPQQQVQQQQQAKQAKQQPKAKAKPAAAKAQKQQQQQQQQQQQAAKPKPKPKPPTAEAEVVVLDSSSEEDSDFHAPAAKRGKKG
ncbi:hypothetical protein ABPG75_003298 [Micractinium tetrahymenae]